MSLSLKDMSWAPKTNLGHMNLMVQTLIFHCLSRHLIQIPVLLWLVCLSYEEQYANARECLDIAQPISFLLILPHQLQTPCKRGNQWHDRLVFSNLWPLQKTDFFFLVSHWLRFFSQVWHLYVVPTSCHGLQFGIKILFVRFSHRKVWYFAFTMQKPLRHTNSRRYRLCLEIPGAFFTGHINVWKPDCKGE